MARAQVLREWTGFARASAPNAPHTPLWARYNTFGAPVMSLMPAEVSAPIPTSTIGRQHRCGFWNAVNRTAPWPQ